MNKRDKVMKKIEGVDKRTSDEDRSLVLDSTYGLVILETANKIEDTDMLSAVIEELTELRDNSTGL